MRLDHLLSMETKGVNQLFGFERPVETESSKKFPVMMRLWDTPVPIPNTKVKTQSAEDTWRGTARENRWLPDSNMGS